VGLERGPLSLVSTIDELLERKSSCSGLESRECGRRDPSHWPGGTLYPQKLALTSPTSGGRSVGIVRLRTQTTALILFVLCWNLVLRRLAKTFYFNGLGCTPIIRRSDRTLSNFAKQPAKYLGHVV
jgi:hypothetical protein